MKPVDLLPDYFDPKPKEIPRASYLRSFLLGVKKAILWVMR